jgi:chitin-binding protein
MYLKKYLVSLLLMFCSASVLAHGLMESPASRNWFCGAVTKPDEVDNGVAKYPICGTAFAINKEAGYSFMTVVTHALGRSVVTPLPKNVCGFDGENWKGAKTPWDVAMQWPTNPMSSGMQDIVWNITWGPHFDDTKEFKYWITKPSFVFSPTKELTWDDFETNPFCVLNYDDKNPSASPNVVADKPTSHFTTKCNVPSRSGHHVIYGEWGRLPSTNERFHGCIDGQFGGLTPTPVVAALSATPANTSVTGATTINFSGSASQGTNLSYQWAVESTNTSLYSFSSSTAVDTTLTLKNPSAQTNFTVRLTVSSGSNTDSATLVFTHSPSAGSSWTDLGALTTNARTLAVGDKVNVRLVDTNGADSYRPNPGLAITASNSDSAAWPLALAQAINSGDGKVQVGVLTNDTITPAQNATSNRVYALSPSQYVSAFLNVVGTAASSSKAASSQAASSKAASSKSSSANSSTGTSTNNCSYIIKDQWDKGFVGAIRITNKRTTAIDGWSVTWNYSDGSKITNSWRTTISGTNPYTGKNVDYNISIQPGQTEEFGFQGNKGTSATALVPTVTGAACN